MVLYFFSNLIRAYVQDMTTQFLRICTTLLVYLEWSKIVKYVFVFATLGKLVIDLCDYSFG